MGALKSILFIMLLCMIVIPVSADKGVTDFYIEYDKVLVDTHLQFDNLTEFMVTLPLDARAITMTVDNVKVNPILNDNILSYNLKNNTKVRYQYISNAYLEGESFITNFIVPIDAEIFNIRVSLPDSAILEKVTAIIPKPNKLGTDGRIIEAIWQLKDTAKDTEFPIIVRYITPVSLYWFFIIPLLMILITILLGMILTRKRPKQDKVEEFKIEKHLKDDEEQIITILKDREDQCEQGTLRVITGFSKAKLSGLLKELEERKVVHREKRGKKNRVFLR